MSDFSAINTALTGLLAQQQALDTTAHNVSNVNTPGYTRQRADLISVGGTIVPGVWSGGAGAGQGVRVDQIERIGNTFLENRSRTDHAASADLGQAQQIATQVQNGFAEPGPNGLSSALADYWSSWDNVANNPTDMATRTSLVGKAQTLATTFNSAASGIRSVWETSLNQLNDQVVQVNSTATTIASLNDRIRVGKAAGLTVNDLVDQRNQLADQLAQSVGGTTRGNTDGTLDVFVGANALVRGNQTSTISVAQSVSGVQLNWGSGGGAFPVAVTSGSVHALLTALNTTLPNYLSNLSAIGTSLAQTVNNQQSLGYTLAQPPALSQPGPPMLALTQVGATSIGEPTLPQLSVAASFTPDQVAAASSANAPGDGSNALAAAELGRTSTGADAQYRAFINGLGNDVQRATTQLSIQKAVSGQSDAALQSQSGVSIDEEMTNMVEFQRAYSASARVLTTIDGMLDTLINHTGV